LRASISSSTPTPNDNLPAVWVIVDGTVADAADLVALDERNFVRGDRFDRRLWRTILNGRIARNTLLTLVARHQGAVVGAIVGEFQPAVRRVLVWSIAVDEAHRGGGLARRLMADLVERTPPACAVVSLEARRDNARARRFYTRLGFREVGEVPGAYADGTDAIYYETSLDELRRALRPSTPPDAGRI
jgi:ribosomal protein S18 acetylase RimI-like enzyme